MTFQIYLVLVRQNSDVTHNGISDLGAYRTEDFWNKAVDLEVQEMAPLGVSLGSNSQGNNPTSKQLRSIPK
jgi:hypothetical protein